MSQFELDLSHHFKGIEARSPSVQSAIKDAENFNMAYANDLASDVFNALYQNNPAIKVADNSQYSQVIRAALRSPTFQHLRMQTRGNLHWSTVAAAHITEKLAEQLAWSEEEKPPQPKTEEPPQKSEPNEGEPIGEGGEPGEPTNQKPSNNGEQPKGEPKEESDFDENEPNNSTDGDQPKDSDSDSDGDSKDQGDNEPESEAEANVDDSDEDIEDDNGENNAGESDEESESDDESDNEDQEGNGPDSEGDNESEQNPQGESQPNEPLAPPSKDVEQALNEASKEATELMGGARAGTNESSIGTKEEAKLAELFTALSRNPQLSKIVQMIGRMQISQHFLNGISYSENQSPVSITVGNNIQNVLPQDLGLLLGNREEFIVFANKYNNKELLQRQMSSEVPAGKGPMIVCLDESGSMYGPRRDWALSITVAMYFQALKESRQFAVIKFATSASPQLTAKSLTRIDPEFMDSIIQEQYLGGGTNFTNPWNNAIKLIRSNRAWKQADIVFVTDGMGGYDPDQWRKDKADSKVRLVTFFVDGSSQLKPSLQYNVRLREMIGLCDAFTYIDDLTEAGEKQAFEVIRNKDAKGFIELTAATVRKGKK